MRETTETVRSPVRLWDVTLLARRRGTRGNVSKPAVAAETVLLSASELIYQCDREDSERSTSNSGEEGRGNPWKGPVFYSNFERRICRESQLRRHL